MLHACCSQLRMLLNSVCEEGICQFFLHLGKTTTTTKICFHAFLVSIRHSFLKLSIHKLIYTVLSLKNAISIHIYYHDQFSLPVSSALRNSCTISSFTVRSSKLKVLTMSHMLRSSLEVKRGSRGRLFHSSPPDLYVIEKHNRWVRKW